MAMAAQNLSIEMFISCFTSNSCCCFLRSTPSTTTTRSWSKEQGQGQGRGRRQEGQGHARRLSLHGEHHRQPHDDAQEPAARDQVQVSYLKHGVLVGKCEYKGCNWLALKQERRLYVLGQAAAYICLRMPIGYLCGLRLAVLCFLFCFLWHSEHCHLLFLLLFDEVVLSLETNEKNIVVVVADDQTGTLLDGLRQREKMMPVLW